MILGTFRCILKMDDCKDEDQMKAFHVPFLAVAVLSDEDPDKLNLGKAMLNALKVEDGFWGQQTAMYGRMLLDGGVCVQDGLGGVTMFDNWEDFEKKFRVVDPYIESPGR